MPVERREQAIAFESGSTGNGRSPVFSGRRQPSRGGTSRMNREVHVRICERLGVKFPGPTRQKRPKLPWLPAAKSTTKQRVKFVPTADIVRSA